MNKRLFSLALLLALLAVWIGAEPAPARAAGFVVNSNADDANAHDWLPGDGLCVDALSRCTLRAAIEEANALAGADTITFDHSMYITLDAAEGSLPSITEQLRIDASGVWDTANNRPGVTLSGGDKSLTGLRLSANNCEVYGLFLINFTSAIDISAAYNTVGGPLQGQRNIIGSNASKGIFIAGSGAHHNAVQGNWIGLSITGDSAQPNDIGVEIGDGAYENTIGGDALNKGNFISGNTQDGIRIYGDNSNGNRLGANFIGVTAVGLQESGNGGSGVYITGPQNTHVGIGGVAGNVIAYNGDGGVSLWSAHNNWIESNAITANKMAGVYVDKSAGNQILSNEIDHNTESGVYVSGAAATGNAILANRIHHNGEWGIKLIDGGNTELLSPVITTASASGAAGAGCAGCAIHLYSDSADEGEIYHGSTNADAGGNWSYSGALDGPHVTATNTDANGNTSRFSLPYDISNSAPNTPANPSPANGAMGVSASAALGWSGGDPDTGDTVTYDVYLGAANPPPLYQSGHPTTTFAPLLNPGVTYYWKIVAKDNHGASTEGPVWSFTTGSNSAPNTPSNPSPADKAGNVSLAPTFSWTGGDPDGDPVRYAVYGGEYSWVTSTLWYSGTAVSFTLGTPLKPDTRYAWSVHAYDDKGGAASGPVWEFTSGALGVSYSVYLPLVVR